ncbi:hypothetical protein FB45DRAFT_1023250 [Roridomyces roridus]|uniref:MARVEL domain-containing protein n=1 Tax=Roridomyces roridus TaxID=1738132 RepID=A0AAD7C427_9AGAR|nr:hypothetical protein FB45DRAFT_1023250 [Roridomyces roridus]
MALIPLVRLVALCVALAFSVIVLGLSAALTSTTEKFLDGYFIFAALAIATSSLAMITLPVMILLEILRPGGFTSMIMVEVSWLFILSVLFLATGADGAQAASDTFTFSCGDYIPTVAAACRETSAIQAFSFLNWIILMAYSVFIFASPSSLQIARGLASGSRLLPRRRSLAPAETSAVQMEATPTTIPASTSTGYPVGAGGTGPTSVQAGTVTV